MVGFEFSELYSVWANIRIAAIVDRCPLLAQNPESYWSIIRNPARPLRKTLVVE